MLRMIAPGSDPQAPLLLFVLIDICLYTNAKERLAQILLFDAHHGRTVANHTPAAVGTTTDTREGVPT